MALPININQLINRRIVESARIEYKGNWNPDKWFYISYHSTFNYAIWLKKNLLRR